MTRALIALVLAAGVVAPARAQEPKTWTLRSGGVVYRLATRDGRPVLDYFGPASKETSWSAVPNAPARFDLAGMADGRSLATDSLELVSAGTRTTAPGVEELRFAFRHLTLPLELEARTTAWGDTGVFTRDVTLTNRGTAAINVTESPSLALSLPGGDVILRYLWGGWGQERQLGAERLGVGARRFEQTKGRSTQGYVPWLSLRNETSGVEVLAQLAWSGNWWMQAERQPDTGLGGSRLRDLDVAVEMGIRHDGGGPLTLEPGASVALPRVAFTAADGDLDDAANRMHRYLRAYVIPRSPTNQPPLVQFNTWYPLTDTVTYERARRLADVAAAIGAEAFVVDSGWYSREEWTRDLGGWEVNRDKFPGGLEALASYVRGKGMRFGLWVEIESVGKSSTLPREHPDWFLSRDGQPTLTWDRYHLDFARPEARAWARATVDRLVKAYGLDWIKIDYNNSVGDRFDSGTGHRLADHVRAYYEWLDELRAAYPSLVVENCASGGLRFDAGVMAHTHTTWISDTVDPVKSIELGYGATLEFPPEVCNHWMVGDKDTGEVNAAADPGWWDFMFRVPMTGQFGISSRATDWPEALRARAAANVALYKRIRTVLAEADVYHLTPPPDHEHPTGWTALEYVAPGGRAVLMAYRLEGGAREATFRLRGLEAGATYALTRDGQSIGRATGAELAAGFTLALDAEWRAAVVEIAR